jgi:SAM-dependent methyltransferase
MQALPSLDTIYQSVRERHVTCGTLLEIGPGSLWPGMHYLARQPDLDLVGVGYGAQEREAARQQARRLNVHNRVRYPESAPERWPVEDKSADAVISYGSLHLWPRPLAVLDEAARVLKHGGKFFIGNVRRDAPWLSTLWFGWRHPGLKTVYAKKNQTDDSEGFKRLMEMSKFSDWTLMTAGPDVWAVSR